jgi:hypothetical protein
MFNAFHYYGDIQEVVIPAKRDKGGRRFGFARFNQVIDARRFETELGNLIIGRDKISVNLSRFQRSIDVRRNDDRIEDKKEREGGRSIERRNGEGHRYRSLSHKVQWQERTFKNEGRSYAQAVRRDSSKKQGEGEQHVFLSYEADQEDLLRCQKAFIGVVAQPGMSYNIQEAFHMEGYFGVKVTPLGSNLTLLEGQEEGEVQALMVDAKGWLDQWFVDIRPWSPDDIDVERTIWLRIYGVPIHAWNHNFFMQIVKPWGTFINADDGTSKKTTMDVARLMIRTSCQQVVDEFIDVKINGKIYHLHVLEDSYGPMRIMISQNKNPDGRDVDEESDEEEEEIERSMFMEEEEEEHEREMEGENVNYVALNPEVNTNNGGSASPKGGANKVNSKTVEVGFCLGQEVGVVGPQNSTNTSFSITGGVNCNGSPHQNLNISQSNGEGENIRGCL